MKQITNQTNFSDNKITKDHKDLQIKTNQSMKNLGLLSQLFEHKNIYFNSSKFNYYHSLVPKLDKLSKYKKIVFHSNYLVQNLPERLLPENHINIHLFKPYYTEQGDHIGCYVATQEIMKQALMALYHVARNHQIGSIEIKSIQNQSSVMDFIKHWKIKNKIIICRVESLLTYLLIEWLHIKEQAIEMIQKISIQIEKSRLNFKRINFDVLLENVLLENQLQLKDFLDYLQIDKLTSKSIFFSGFNFVHKGKEITTVMLPWGLELAEQLTQALYQLNPAIKRIGVVGGVGYTGNDECKVDDIFIPDSFMDGDDEIHQIREIKNGINSSQNTQYFKDYTIVEGCLKSVFPEIGKLSNIQTYRKSLHKIDALDMEFEAIYRVVKEHTQTNLGVIYYIMDLLRQNINLGDTYYRRQFLEELFETFKRGKLFCFEKVVSYVAEDDPSINQIQKGHQA